MATTHFNGPVQSTNGFIGTLSGALTSVTQLTDSTGAGAANDTIADADTVTALTDSTGGTADGTLADGTGTYSQTIFNNNFADVAAKINGILTDLATANQNMKDLTVKINAIIAALD